MFLFHSKRVYFFNSQEEATEKYNQNRFYSKYTEYFSRLQQ